ncbi:hypothetical protein SISNIDRAFT_467333 [Sistotremastrum niveocremeum HHB9708]|uniref:F-box domain-containing protein n=1 Tax=Sistotremastrum niveocremeum HHB9708 TaxID=1314777 RepID=A0A164SRC9_9AGAM|nr:hypothetical protein SISNIDRAFT_467333 [Sistotremastrum niveocremeum HHB9708]
MPDVGYKKKRDLALLDRECEGVLVSDWKLKMNVQPRQRISPTSLSFETFLSPLYEHNVAQVSLKIVCDLLQFVDARRLPDELILDILARCAKDHPSGRFSPKGMFFPAAFCLCSKWRKIAIQSPSLWTDISLPMSSIIFNLFLSRSRNLPLSIDVDIEDMPSSKEALDSLGSSLRQSLARVSFLRMVWSPRHVEKSLNVFLSDQFGDSEFTTLSCFKIDSYDSFDEPIVSLNMPRLEILDYSSHISSFPKFMDTSTIIDLSLAGTDAQPDEVLDLLCDFPCLEYFVMGSSDEPVLIGSHDVVRLEKLKMFSVSECHVDPVDYVIRHLQVPSSAYMRLDTWEFNSSVSLQDFIGPYILQCHEYNIDPARPSGSSQPFLHSLSSKSICNMYIWYEAKGRPEIVSLQELAPYFINLSVIKLDIQILPSVPELIRTISFWPNIVHLGIHTREEDFERLLEAFRISPGLPCPLLESLDCTRTKFKAESMGQFLAARKNRGVPIQNLTFTEGFATETESVTLSTRHTAKTAFSFLREHDTREYHL